MRERDSLFRHVDRVRRILVQYRREVDEWRSEHDETDHRRICLDVLWMTFRFERQSKPDERWHFMVSQRSRDGLGFSHHGGWARQGGSRHYYTGAHLDWWLTFSMRPIYKLVYAPSWIQSLARLTGKHPIEIAERYVAEGREIVSALPVEGATKE